MAWLGQSPPHSTRRASLRSHANADLGRSLHSAGPRPVSPGADGFGLLACAIRSPGQAATTCEG
eukprot:15484941-Alexandrium_andersonii.AAC.1